MTRNLVAGGVDFAQLEWRRKTDARIFRDSTPEVYETRLRRMVEDTVQIRQGDEQLLFVNAWNEWAEGDHLEPDQRRRASYLEAMGRAHKLL